MRLYGAERRPAAVLFSLCGAAHDRLVQLRQRHDGQRGRRRQPPLRPRERHDAEGGAQGRKGAQQQVDRHAEKDGQKQHLVGEKSPAEGGAVRGADIEGMEQFQKGEDEEGDRDGCFVPPQAQAADKGAHAQHRLHQAVDGDGGERLRRKQVRRAHGRTAHAVGIRDFRPQREDGQAIGDEVDPQQLGGGEEIEAVQRQGDDEDG